MGKLALSEWKEWLAAAAELRAQCVKEAADRMQEECEKAMERHDLVRRLRRQVVPNPFYPEGEG